MLPMASLNPTKSIQPLEKLVLMGIAGRSGKEVFQGGALYTKEQTAQAWESPNLFQFKKRP